MSCFAVLIGGDKGNLSVVATVFDKLNQVYKEYLDAEQAYTAVSGQNSCITLYLLNTNVAFIVEMGFSGYGIRPQSLQRL